MQPVNFRVILKRETGYVIFEGIERKITWLMIDTRTGELIVAFDDFGVEVAEQQCCDELDVLVISDSSSVVDFSNKIVESFVGNRRLFVQVHFQLHFGGVEVRVHPFIGDVPADSSIFPPLEDDCVEKGQRKNEQLVFLCF